LMKLDSLGAYHTAPLPYGAEAIPASCPVQISGGGDFVLGMFGSGSKPSAFMIVNRNYTQPAAATVTITIPGRRLQELDRKTGKWSRGQSPGAKRTTEIKLAPGDGRLFRMAK